MSLSKAVNFSFINNNFNKIIQIAIVFGIISAIEYLLNESGIIGLGSLIGGIGGLFFGLFVSGYGIFVMRNILNGDERLPAFNIGTSIKRGFQIFLASIVYFLPFLIVMGIVIYTIVVPVAVNEFYTATYPDAYVSPTVEVVDPMTLTIASIVVLAIIPVTFILGYALQLGMVRFAAEDRSGALYEFGTNIGMVFKNFGKIFKLFWMQIALIICVVIISFGVLFVMGVALFAFSQVTAIMFLFVVLFQIVTQLVNIGHQMANLHLIAGMASEIGIVSGKLKNDDMADVAYEA